MPNATSTHRADLRNVAGDTAASRAIWEGCYSYTPATQIPKSSGAKMTMAGDVRPSITCVLCCVSVCAAIPRECLPWRAVISCSRVMRDEMPLTRVMSALLLSTRPLARAIRGPAIHCVHQSLGSLNLLRDDKKSFNHLVVIREGARSCPDDVEKRKRLDVRIPMAREQLWTSTPTRPQTATESRMNFTPDCAIIASIGCGAHARSYLRSRAGRGYRRDRAL